MILQDVQARQLLLSQHWWRYLVAPLQSPCDPCPPHHLPLQISIMPTLDYYGWEHEDAITGFIAEWSAQLAHRHGWGGVPFDVTACIEKDKTTTCLQVGAQGLEGRGGAMWCALGVGWVLMLKHVQQGHVCTRRVGGRAQWATAHIAGGWAGQAHSCCSVTRSNHAATKPACMHPCLCATHWPVAALAAYPVP